LPINSNILKNYGDKLLDLNEDENDEDLNEDYSKESE